MWAGGLITQFTSFNSASSATLLDLKNNAIDDAHGDVHSVKSMIQPSVFAAYGVTDNLTLGIRLPYVQRFGVRSPNEDGDAVNNQGDPGGFGGVSVFSQYRFFHTLDNLNHLSLVVALKTPSGMTHVKTNQGERFETHHQPNSGAWSPSVGFSFTRAMGKFSFDSSVLYTVATTGSQKTDLGDTFDYNVALSYAFVGVAKNNLFVDSNNAPVDSRSGTQRHVAGSSKDRSPDRSELGRKYHFYFTGIRYAGGKNWNTALSVGTPISKTLMDIKRRRIIGSLTVWSFHSNAKRDTVADFGKDPIRTLGYSHAMKRIARIYSSITTGEVSQMFSLNVRQLFGCLLLIIATVFSTTSYSDHDGLTAGKADYTHYPQGGRSCLLLPPSARMAAYGASCLRNGMYTWIIRPIWARPSACLCASTMNRSASKRAARTAPALQWIVPVKYT